MKINLLLEKSKYSETQLQALTLLEESEEFSGEITAVRKRFSVPTGGYTVQLSPEGKVLNPDDVANAINQSVPWIDQAVTDLIWLFDLPIGWYGTLVGIVLFQSAPPPDVKPDAVPISVEYSGVVGLDDLLKKAKKQTERTPKSTNQLTISVSEKMSFKALIAELNKNKPLIDRYLSVLPSTPNLSRTKDLEIKKEILGLTKAGKTDREIADFFLEKYPDKTVFHDEATISKYRNRFKAHLASLPKRMQLRQLMKTMGIPETT